MSNGSMHRDHSAARWRSIVWLGLLAAGFAAASAQAQFGPHANAVLVPHIEPGLEYSFGQSYEGQSTLRSCEDAIVAGPVIGGEEIPARIFYVIISFENSPGPVCMAGLDFGFGRYNPSAISIVDHGLCNDGYLSIPTDGWPGPNEGVALLFQPFKKNQKVVEVAWFAAYVYGQGTLPLGPDPATHMAAVSQGEEQLPIIDELEESQLGILAFGTEGYNPCAPPIVPGACCLSGRCQRLYRSDCDMQGGVFQGENTSCFPNPCLPPKPTTWGRLKRMYDSP